MFKPTGLFKGIPCPEGPDNCRRPGCIFSHEKVQGARLAANVLESKAQSNDDDIGGRQPKRLKHDHGSQAISRPQITKEKQSESSTGKPFVGALTHRPDKGKDGTTHHLSRKTRRSSVGNDQNEGHRARAPSQPEHGTGITKSSATMSGSGASSVSGPILNTISKPISPPPKRNTAAKETLNPRLVPTNPAAHIARLGLLRLIHKEISRLNDAVGKMEDEDAKPLRLSPDAVIRLALDEEETVARTQSSIYRSVMGHRVVQYKKMDVTKWIDLQKETKAKREGLAEKVATPQNPFLAGLTVAQELFMLPRFVAKTDGLDKFGYVLVPPTEAEISNSNAAVKASDYWEACDRCGSRFQVFPNRREDGALTSGGKCRYHFGKLRRPVREKADKITGGKATVFACCEKEPGTAGCVIHDTHVYKTTDRKRLATVLPFECTPENPTAKPDMAISFDCEMGYTTCGFEMIRLSACTWPLGETLIDVLVRPVGHILDLNTRFSGVTPEQFLNAIEFDPSHGDSCTADANDTKSENETRLRIVPSPAAARDLLLSHIAPSTPLIGHAIENDLNVVRLIHPTIVDTALLFPAPGGLPYRLALKRLSKEFLNRDIQISGANGHDSMEDARATGDLVRCKIAKEWTVLKASGWTVSEEDGFKGPKGWDGEGMPRTVGKYCVAVPNWWARKRKRNTDGGEEEADTAEPR